MRFRGTQIVGVMLFGATLGLSAVGCGGGNSAGGSGGGSATATGGKAAGGSGTGTGGSAAGTGSGSGSGGSAAGAGGTPAAGSGGAGPVGAGATGGAGPSDAAVVPGDIGKACDSAGACGGGMTCLLPTDKVIFGQGGPANGYCTFPCTTTDTSMCDATGSSCVDMARNAGDPPQSYCLQDCVFGTAGAASKCRMRDDVACTQLSAGPDGGVAAEVCVPTCSQDSQCPAGRKCDEMASVCVDAQPAGSAQGAHCDSTAATDTCAGVCLPLGDGTTVRASFCSRRCVVGLIEQCNWVNKTTSLATGGTHGICALSSAGADLGDVGYCVQECATANDCSNKTDPGGRCDTTTIDPMINSHGFCSWTGPSDGGAGG